MLDYDAEAALYDATRGGVPRAEAAARAVLGLVPARARTLLGIGIGIGCGTVIVTARPARPGLRVIGAGHGLLPVADAHFTGHGQGRSPLRTAAALRKVTPGG